MQLTACFLPSADDIHLASPPILPTPFLPAHLGKTVSICQHHSLFHLWAASRPLSPGGTLVPSASMPFPNLLCAVLFREAPHNSDVGPAILPDLPCVSLLRTCLSQQAGAPSLLCDSSCTRGGAQQGPGVWGWLTGSIRLLPGTLEG